LKLIAKYNPDNNEHLSGTQCSDKDMTTKLSPTIQNESMELLGKMVDHRIPKEAKDAQYFSISLDRTPG